MRTLITVRTPKGVVYHWFREREVVGPYTQTALCGERARPHWIEEDPTIHCGTCQRCIDRLHADERAKFYPITHGNTEETSHERSQP